MARLPATACRRASSLVASPLRPHLAPSPATPCTSSPASATTTRSIPAARRNFHASPSHGARLVPRPRRPYTFTQLIQQSDGATFTVRTTSPQPVLKAARDTRNHALWQPSDRSLRNVELDEAGKLAAFRERYGRGFDLDAAADEADAEALAEGETEGGAPTAVDAGADAGTSAGGFDLYADLISGYAAGHEEKVAKAPVATRTRGKDKKSK